MIDKIKIIPFRAQRSVSIAALYSVPQTHVIYVGPAECARHNCRMNYYWGRMSFLCPSDADLALGNTEDLIFKAVAELIERYRQDGNELRGIILFTGCQTRFMSIDFERVMRKVRNDLNIRITHFEESRFRRFDHASTQQTDLRISILRLIDDKKIDASGITFLTDFKNLCSDHEYKRIKTMYDASWARSTGDCCNFDEFSQISSSAVNIIISEQMKKSAEYLKKEYNTPYIFLPPSVRLQNICSNYEKLSDVLNIKGCMDQLYDLENIYRKRISDTAALYMDKSIDIDLSRAEDVEDILMALAEYGFNVSAVKIRKRRYFRGPDKRRASAGIHTVSFDEGRDDEMIHKIRSIFPEIEISYAEEQDMDFSHDFINGETIYGLNNVSENIYGEMPSACAQAATPENSEYHENYLFNGEYGWGFTALERFLDLLEKAVEK